MAKINSLTIKNWSKKYPHSYCPLVLPEKFLKCFNKTQQKDLMNDKVVFIKGYWCILAKHLPCRTK